jgi:CHAT domain-containing protein
MIAFVVTPDRFAAVPLPVSAVTAGARARNLAELLEKGDDAASRRVGSRLDQELIAPIRGLISPAVTRLVVVPDGALNTIPFEALSRANGSQTRLLLEDWTISYSPSATVLVALSRQPPPAPFGKDLIVFADPDLGRPAGGDRRDVWRSYEEEGLGIGELPHTAQEARLIARVVSGAEVLTGAAASEREAKHGPLGRFRILHFATHGLASERHPSRSALVLAVGENDPEDGLLQAREIARLRLASDLVVLSGCRTGRGRLLSGEGVLGLARAFFAAGSRAVIASLWDVHDERTARFMEAFYRRLAAGASKGEALRQAKLESLRGGGEASSPRDWAAFVLIGDAGGTVPLSARRERARWPLIALATLAAAAVLAVLAPRLRRRFGSSRPV